MHIYRHGLAEETVFPRKRHSQALYIGSKLRCSGTLPPEPSPWLSNKFIFMYLDFRDLFYFCISVWFECVIAHAYHGVFGRQKIRLEHLQMEIGLICESYSVSSGTELWSPLRAVRSINYYVTQILNEPKWNVTVLTYFWWWLLLRFYFYWYV